MVSSRSLALCLIASSGTSFHVHQEPERGTEQFHLDDEVTLAQLRSTMPRQQHQQETALETEDPLARVEAVIAHTEVSQLEIDATNKDAQQQFPMKDDWHSEVAASKTAYQPLPIKESFWMRLVAFYVSSLEVAPHLTNAFGAFIITTMGDAVAQMVEYAGKYGPWRGFDVKRNLALAITASMYNGMVLTSWLMAINRRLPGTEFRIVMGKLAATQTFLQPFVYVPFFFVIHGLLRGQSATEIRSRFTADYFALLFRLWSLFMPTRFMMFLLVPVRYQVLWDSSVAFIWQVALSLFNAKNRRAVPEAMISGKKGGSPFLLKTRAFSGAMQQPPTVEGDAPVQTKIEQ